MVIDMPAAILDSCDPAHRALRLSVGRELEVRLGTEAGSAVEPS